jgi:DNA-binding transcriptional LysR family regulator
MLQTVRRPSIGGYRPATGLQILPYRSDKLVAIMPVGHTLAERKKVRFAELAEFDLVGPQKGSFLDSLVMKAVGELNLTLKMRIRVNGFETVCSMVEASLGVGLAPERCAKRYVATGKSRLCRLMRNGRRATGRYACATPPLSRLRSACVWST